MNVCELCTEQGAPQYDPAPAATIGAKMSEFVVGPGAPIHLHDDCLALLRSGELALIARSILDLQDTTTKAENAAQAADNRRAKAERHVDKLGSELFQARSTITDLRLELAAHESEESE